MFLLKKLLNLYRFSNFLQNPYFSTTNQKLPLPQIVTFNQYQNLPNKWMIIDKIGHGDAVAEGAIAWLLGSVIQCVFGSGQNVRDL